MVATDKFQFWKNSNAIGLRSEHQITLWSAHSEASVYDNASFESKHFFGVIVILRVNNEFSKQFLFIRMDDLCHNICNLIELNKNFLARNSFKLLHIFIHFWISIRIESKVLTFVVNLMGELIDPQHEKNGKIHGPKTMKTFQKTNATNALWSTFSVSLCHFVYTNNVVSFTKINCAFICQTEFCFSQSSIN